MRKTKLEFFLFLVLFAACAPAAEPNMPQAAHTETAPTAPASPTATVTPTNPSADIITVTEDTRMDPEDWMEWPIIPEVSATTRAIYREGLAMGKNPQAFSKVGDCQNLKEYFLGRFDHLDLYEYEWDITPYVDTIEHFTGNFDRDGQAAKFGFTAASPLSQLQADPEVCLPGETPLECELRMHQPTFVIISLEFPFNGRTPQLYTTYIRQIIDYTISQGAVPILATKADNVEGDHAINRAIAALAYEYDIPLWNWWRAAQPLGDHGIDPYRDGFHISQQAWAERSKTCLMVLDHLWKELREE